MYLATIVIFQERKKNEKKKERKKNKKKKERKKNVDELI